MLASVARNLLYVQFYGIINIMLIHHEYSAPTHESGKPIKGVLYDADFSIDPPEVRVFYTRGKNHTDMLLKKTDYPTAPFVEGIDGVGQLLVSYYDDGNETEVVTETKDENGNTLRPCPDVVRTIAQQVAIIGLSDRRATQYQYGTYDTEAQQQIVKLSLDYT